MSCSSGAIRCRPFQGAREGCLDKDQMKAGKKDDADQDQVLRQELGEAMITLLYE